MTVYTDNKFKKVPLIQVTSGGQKSLLKKVCESQKSCLFVGDQILIFLHNLQINSLKILQFDFLDFFLILSVIVEVTFTFTFKSFSRRSYPERLTNWCIHLMTSSGTATLQ